MKIMGEQVELSMGRTTGTMTLSEALTARWEGDETARRTIREEAAQFAGRIHEVASQSDRPSDSVQVEIHSTDGITLDALPFDFAGATG